MGMAVQEMDLELLGRRKEETTIQETGVAMATAMATATREGRGLQEQGLEG
jgi:hypothetical protein